MCILRKIKSLVGYFTVYHSKALHTDSPAALILVLYIQCTVSFCSTGLMADKLGSYAPSFYTMGAITIVGASITSLMAFVKQQPEESLKTESYSEELLVTEKVTVL